jgi:hypothetical protein
LSLEQPATPATAIVAAPMAINNSRFTEFSFCCDRRPPRACQALRASLLRLKPMR